MTTTDILWRQTASEVFNSDPLAGEATADVVIIGAGFTGLSAALHLSEAGMRVCVLEAEIVGYGGSGRNVGLVNAGLWTPPDEVEQMLGKETGRALNMLLAEAPETVFALIEKHGMSCEAVRSGTLHCAVGLSGLRDLQNRYAQQRARNAPVELLDADETIRRTGSPGFEGALFDRRAGTIQPFAYAHGLALAGRAAGAEIHEKSQVLQIAKSGHDWHVRTPDGGVRARILIQATNAYGTADLNKNAHTLVHYFQAATQPLTKELRKKILPGGEGCWDTATVMSSFRLDASGRLIVGAVGNLEGFGASSHRSWVKRKIQALYPHLPPLDFEHAWTGKIAMTQDHLPKVAEIGENAISVFGYSGRGIGPGTVFGKCAARWAMSGKTDAFPIPIHPMPADRLAALKGLYYETGATLYHLTNAR